MSYRFGKRKSLRSHSSPVFYGLWDTNLSSRMPSYLFQCGLATVFLIVALLVVDVVFNAAIVVAVASTAFTVFVVPNSIASSPRRVIGGHSVAVATGSLLSLIIFIPEVTDIIQESRYVQNIAAALSVGLGILMMVLTDTEHPPAAGTALGLVIRGWTLSAVGFIMVSAVILTILRIVLRPRLINLI